jgi:hypothetical protein
MKDRLAVLLCLMLPFTVCPAADNTEPLLGAWHGDDHASGSIYGTLTITPTHVAWEPGNRFNKGCKTEYEVVSRSVGDTFPGQPETFRHKTEGRTYTTLKLKLAPRPCTNRVAFMQFSLPSDVQDYVDLVEYDETDQQRGWMHFGRIAPASK